MSQWAREGLAAFALKASHAEAFVASVLCHRRQDSLERLCLHLPRCSTGRPAISPLHLYTVDMFRILCSMSLVINAHQLLHVIRASPASKALRHKLARPTHIWNYLAQ